MRNTSPQYRRFRGPQSALVFCTNRRARTFVAVVCATPAEAAHLRANKPQGWSGGARRQLASLPPSVPVVQAGEILKDPRP